MKAIERMISKKPESDFVCIGKLLGQLLRTCRRASGGEAMQKVWEHWEKCLPEVICQNAKPQRIKDKQLLVCVYSPVWMHQLQFQKEELIDLLNGSAGEDLIADIRFKIGTL
jgi:predicted nucleic acid-binding Zn ribbon protein